MTRLTCMNGIVSCGLSSASANRCWTCIRGGLTTNLLNLIPCYSRNGRELLVDDQALNISSFLIRRLSFDVVLAILLVELKFYTHDWLICGEAALRISQF